MMHLRTDLALAALEAYRRRYDQRKFRRSKSNWRPAAVKAISDFDFGFRGKQFRNPKFPSQMVLILVQAARQAAR